LHGLMVGSRTISYLNEFSGCGLRHQQVEDNVERLEPKGALGLHQ
jgi:hypothetical protein